MKPIIFHPLALLHSISIDTYYRNLRGIIDHWKTNMNENKHKKACLLQWKLSFRTKKNYNKIIQELFVLLKNENYITPSKIKSA